MSTPSRDLEHAIRDYLTLKRWLVWKNSAGIIGRGGRLFKAGTVGLPDLMALRDGRLLCIEVKAGKDTLRDDQVRWLADAEKHGALTVVARSLQDVIDRLEKP